MGSDEMKGIIGEAVKKYPWILMFIILGPAAGTGYFSSFIGVDQAIKTEIATLQKNEESAKQTVTQLNTDVQSLKYTLSIYKDEGRLETPEQRELHLRNMLDEFREKFKKDIIEVITTELKLYEASQ